MNSYRTENTPKINPQVKESAQGFLSKSKSRHLNLNDLIKRHFSE